jgi:archaeal type IV pilus assembly protein PilA
MKGNQAARHVGRDEDAVSPVIAVILMVAITVVLSATVYLFAQGFGAASPEILAASFAAKAVDMPNGDADTNPDAIELTYTSGKLDLSADEVQLFVDGQSLTWLAASTIYVQGGTYGAGDLCASSPGGDADNTWERGTSLHLVDTHAATGTVSDCDGSPTVGQLADLTGLRQVKVVVRGQVVLDAQVRINDNAST